MSLLDITPPKPLTEDDIYRASSQYRIWSFSPDRLASLRQKTHELAIERIEEQASSKDASKNEYLTEDEELRLVTRYCEQVRTTNDHFKWPVNVKATAVQYLRRFYVSNSVMTYPPKEIYKTALFLACKTEATHMTLSEYARRISSKPEEILAPEYKLMQALRFTLDVRQPFRGLKGILMELLNMAEGLPQESYQDEVKQLGPPSKDSQTSWKARPGPVELAQIQDRARLAYGAARGILDYQALMTDVYFHFTPSQIAFAAMTLADDVLTDYLLSKKLPADTSMSATIMSTIKACADMLRGFTRTSVLTKEERAALEAKLELCRDASTKNLIENHLNRKLGDPDDEEKAKKRQAARERTEQEGHDLFGPSLATNGTSKG